MIGAPPLVAGGDHVDKAPLHWLETAKFRGAPGAVARTVVVVVEGTVVVVVGGTVVEVVVVGATAVVVVVDAVVVVSATVVVVVDVADSGPPKAPRPFGVPMPVGPS